MNSLTRLFSSSCSPIAAPLLRLSRAPRLAPKAAACLTESVKNTAKNDPQIRASASRDWFPSKASQA